MLPSQLGVPARTGSTENAQVSSLLDSSYSLVFLNKGLTDESLASGRRREMASTPRFNIAVSSCLVISVEGTGAFGCEFDEIQGTRDFKPRISSCRSHLPFPPHECFQRRPALRACQEKLHVDCRGRVEFTIWKRR